MASWSVRVATVTKVWYVVVHVYSLTKATCAEEEETDADDEEGGEAETYTEADAEGGMVVLTGAGRCCDRRGQ